MATDIFDYIVTGAGGQELYNPEQNDDADGIIWPWPVAPYHVHLVSLDSNSPDVASLIDCQGFASVQEGWILLETGCG